jgi:hypothetical protein
MALVRHLVQWIQFRAVVMVVVDVFVSRVPLKTFGVVGLGDGPRRVLTRTNPGKHNPRVSSDTNCLAIDGTWYSNPVGGYPQGVTANPPVVRRMSHTKQCSRASPNGRSKRLGVAARGRCTVALPCA